jgi:hypothetical protein
MRLLPLLFVLAITACNTNNSSNYLSEEELNDSTSTINIEALVTMTKAKTYRFYIPNIYTLNIKGPTIDTILSSNYLSLNDGKFIATLYADEAGNKLTAINRFVSTELCIQYFSSILKNDSNGIPVNIFEEAFPNLSAYSFYDFEDKFLKQLEGDEETAFAGYRLNLSKADSIGVQFMFCNKKNSVNSDFMNENGNIIFKNYNKL